MINIDIFCPKSFLLVLVSFLISLLFTDPVSADTWVFTEEGYTSGCLTECEPGTQCNGPYFSGPFTLDVTTTDGEIRGSGWCIDLPFCDPPNQTFIYGSISGSRVAFRRWHEAFTPGYTIRWRYSGTISGMKITGVFGGDGAPSDPNALGCYTQGTFSIQIIKGNSSIAGQITLSNGVGLSAAEVYAYRSRCDSGSALGGALATGLGEYRIQNLTPGTYYVMSRSPETDHVPTWWNGGSGTQRCNQASKIDLADYENRSGIDIVLEEGGSVSGEISDSSGAPVEGQLVYAALDRCNTRTRFATDGTSNSSGRYMIQGLPSGSVYLFTFQALEDDQYAVYWWNQEGGHNDCGFAEPAHILVNQNNPGYDFVLP
jgi:hypothetical protein